jgi:hypothetical protein
MRAWLQRIAVPALAVVCCALPVVGNRLQAALADGPRASADEAAAVFGGQSCDTYPVASLPVCQISRVDTCPGSTNCNGLCPYNCTFNTWLAVTFASDSGRGYQGGPYVCPPTTFQACLSGLFTCYCGGVNFAKQCGNYNQFQFSTCYPAPNPGGQ